MKKLKPKRLCRAQRRGSEVGVVECGRKFGHKGCHRVTWREGLGDYIEITAEWR